MLKLKKKTFISNFPQPEESFATESIAGKPTKTTATTTRTTAITTTAMIHSFDQQGGGEELWAVPAPLPSPISSSWMEEETNVETAPEADSEDVVFSPG